jgi:hypothetical protein
LRIKKKKNGSLGSKNELKKLPPVFNFYMGSRLGGGVGNSLLNRSSVPDPCDFYTYKDIGSACCYMNPDPTRSYTSFSDYSDY